MAFCTECGANVPADMRFCTGCGKPVEVGPTSPAAAPQVQPVTVPQGQAPAVVSPAAPPPVQQPAYQAQPSPPAVQAYTYTAPPASPPVGGRGMEAPPPPKGSKYALMSTGAFFGLMLLFSIPIVGWVACIIMAFAGTGQNRKNFARAMLIFLLIGIALSVVVYFVSGWVLEVMLEYYVT